MVSCQPQNEELFVLEPVLIEQAVATYPFIHGQQLL
jgi:hypothetical protein